MIYIHIPFCRSFCTYCDFYSEVAAECRSQQAADRQEALFSSFADALALEARVRGYDKSDKVNTLYIGGGTPSVLPLSAFRTIADALKAVGQGGPYDEFTVEVNPEDIVMKGEAYVEGLRDMGVNRVSMGVQSFDDGILRFMNRRHDAAMAEKAYAVLEEAGMHNISIDLIFGLPQLTDELWEKTLDKALSLSGGGNPPRHISSYQLSVEPGSMLAKLVEKGLFEEASDDICARQYEILCSRLGQAGYRHYEISNFAQPGYEAVHNSAYWKHVPYVGLGPGAHSLERLESGGWMRRWNRDDLQGYLMDPAGVWESEILDEEQIRMERLMLALRTSDGVDGNILLSGNISDNIRRLVEEGSLIRTDKGGFRIPEDHFFVSDSIITDIV